MSSVDAASTNDVSSTARSTAATEAGDDDNGLLAQPINKKTAAAAPAIVLTSDGIIKECIKQGFYRNPICNEKLYLHNKGYDSIAPTAFELYTDVKVLWLEGNALAALPCGGELIRTRPPRTKSALYSSSSSSSSCASLDAEMEAGTVGKPSDRQGATRGEQAHHADPFRGLDEEETDEQAKEPRKPHRHSSDTLPRAADIPLEDRDAFSSLYPTVRQLYLHNNIFRTMPDLSRFERLHSVNLANNFFTRVEPHCPHWDRGLRDEREAQEEAERTALGLPAKSDKGMTPTQHVTAARGGDSKDEVTVVPAAAVVATSADTATTAEKNDAEEGVAALSPEEARSRRDELLASYKQLVEQHASYCPHTALPEKELLCESGVLPRKTERVPRAFRNPCSSLHSLNLAGNHIQSFDDLLGLLCYKALRGLDLSQNRVDDGEALLLILERLEHLKSLKLSGNPLVRSLPRYRKTVLARCPGLMHLDDRPVFPDERRLVTAWAAGGEVAERRERARIKAENDAAVRKRVDDFRALLNTYRNGDGAAGEPAGAEGAQPMHRMDPSHADFVNAITGSGADAKARVRQGRRPSNSDPDPSPTSSEEDEEEEEGGTQRVNEAAQTDADGAGPAASSAPPAARVLSSNGRQLSLRAKQVMAEGVPHPDDNDKNASDVYIPS